MGGEQVYYCVLCEKKASPQKEPFKYEESKQ